MPDSSFSASFTSFITAGSSASGALFFHRQIALGLRIFLQAGLQFAQRLAALVHDSQNLKRANDAIARGGEITENDVTALFAAKIEFLLHHFFKHVAVTDFCAHDFSATRGERFIEAKIAHDGGDDRVLLQPASFQKIQRCNGENLVAIHNLAVLVAKKNAIGIAVVRNADIRAAYLDDALDLLRMHAAATVVDVHAIRLVMRHGDVRAQLAQNARRGFVGSAIRDIDSDAHFLERHSPWKTCFGEFHVAARARHRFASRVRFCWQSAGWNRSRRVKTSCSIFSSI